MRQKHKMTSSGHQELAQSILANRDEVLLGFDHIGHGSSADVYHLKTSQADYALRIGTDNSRDITPKMDANLRQCLIEHGVAVAKPFAHSLIEKSGNYFWSLDQYCRGNHPVRGRIAPEICRDIGRSLALIHSLKTSGIGRPHRIENKIVHGLDRSPLDAIISRFDHPIPQSWEDGFKHPIFETAPELEVPVRAFLNNVVDASRSEPPVLCHSDLHEKQFICDDNSLVAIIDFGKTTILNRYWDFGSFLYFHGKQQLQWLLEAYGRNPGGQVQTEQVIKAHAISIAMHHAMRSRISGKGHRLAFALSRIKSIMTD